MGEKLDVSDEARWAVACGTKNVFPAFAIERLALELSRSLDCHVPIMDCEAAAVVFVRALIEHGWEISPSLPPIGCN